MKRILFLSIVVVLVLTAGALFYVRSFKSEMAPPPTAMADAPKEGAVLTIGSISNSIREEVETIQPFADLLASRMKTLGVSGARVAVAPTIKKMAELVEMGAVDIFFDSAYPIHQLVQLTGAELFLRQWKRGERSYRTVLFVRKESGIRTLEDLKGKIIAFDEPASTSGHVIPLAMLIQANLDTEKFTEPATQVPPGKVGYVFSEDDENTLFWVLEKRVPAGAIDLRQFKKKGGERVSELRIIAQSIDVPRQIMAHRADLDPRWISSIREILLAIHKDPKAKAALYKMKKTTRFELFQPDAATELKAVNEMINLVANAKQ